MHSPFHPNATYRLQFTPEFTFEHARAIIPYLKSLGISHIYASPVTRARTGSMHGYDVCDPLSISTDLGGKDALITLITEAKKNGIGWIQDIVPNHMAYSQENPYLVDVLEQGRASRYADFFDITWNHQHKSLKGKVLAPFLGKPYGQCVVDGDLRIVIEKGSLWVAYYEHRFPLAPHSYRMVFTNENDLLQPSTDIDPVVFVRFNTILETLAGFPEKTSVATLLQHKAAFAELISTDPGLQQLCASHTARVSTGTPGGNTRFDQIMSGQNYRLAFWKVAAEELNYRRFFTISDLICLHIEQKHVYETTHALILEFIDKHLFDGLRIDHIDGLFNPTAYLNRLRKDAPDAWIVVEKILNRNEQLPSDWPIEGSTGYDFLNHINYLFCERKSEGRFNRLYERIAGREIDPTELQRDKKRLIIGKHMAGDIDNLAHLILSVASADLMGRDITLYALRRAIVEVLTHFPVYRSYITAQSYSDFDASCIREALTLSRRTHPGMAIEYDFIERFLMMKGDTILQKEFDDHWKNAVMRFQQFTGPLMAKGFEDTLFYVYNRHVVLNEVGGWPVHFGISLKEFHAFIRTRGSTHPFSMNATATHDTKRGEDTRARLQVLSELPVEWGRQLFRWKKMTAANLTAPTRNATPDYNDEYLFYQTLAGTLPFDGTINAVYISRIKQYMIKAIREAKVHTAWIKPDEQYEQAVLSFIESCLAGGTPSFIEAVTSFVNFIAWFGILNSLSQATLKLTLPGVPDFYQGTEFWDFSLVDPDNRRPVDYSIRAAALTRSSDIPSLLADPFDGAIKQFIINKLLDDRSACANLYRQGTYMPLSARGIHATALIAFSRVNINGSLLVMVPRFTTRLVEHGTYPIGRQVWQDTRITLPQHLRKRTLVNVCTRETLVTSPELFIGDLLATFPVGVYRTA